MTGIWDCIVIGAGPAGLSAALYLARFRRTTLVLHDASARALRIPLTHNAPGFPEGVAGPELISRMTAHAETYGAHVAQASIVDLKLVDDHFEVVAADGQQWRARSCVLATGVALNQVALDPVDHEAAIASGVLRYCPVCDGYEHIGQRIGVVGCDEQGAGEALFLRSFSDDVTLVPRCHSELTADERAQLDAAGIKVIDRPLRALKPDSEGFVVEVEGDDQPLRFDVVYPALGVRPRSELAIAVGLMLADGDKSLHDSPFGTEIPGLYTAGDIVEGLDQISVAMAHGAIAATKAHNWLRTQDGQALERDG